MAARKNREQIVIATKYTTSYPNRAGPNPPKWFVNYQGQHAKSLKVSVEASLKKLQTDYIDLLYIHWWDFTTSIPEIMQSLNHLVAQGKVR
jgi:aryl-alcohol dehydrogenase-like predicted oxidoreductase